MQITGLHIDRFGVWSDLKMDGLDDGMTVFYGPNEAGKSTLMQYIRTVLYGFEPVRCKRFVAKKRRPGIENTTLQSADESMGGSVFASSAMVGTGGTGDWHIRRLADMSDPLGHPGEVNVTGPDGQREGAQRLNTLLSGIDEAIYNNVFAVGLREMQQLGALNDTQAARQLYSLSTGTDRVSLVDVTRQLQSTRCRLVGCDDQTSLLGELVSQQNRCRAAMEQMSTQSDRWASMVAERDAMEEEISRLETARGKSTSRTRLAQVALQTQPHWEELRRLDRELDSLGTIPKIAPRTIETIRALAQESNSLRERLEELQFRREELREQVETREVNESVGRHSARILAMLDQRRTINALDARVVQLQNELDEAELEILAEQERLGLRWDSATASTTNVRPTSTATTSAAANVDAIIEDTLSRAEKSDSNLSRSERKRRRKNNQNRTGPRNIGPQSTSDRDSLANDPYSDHHPESDFPSSTERYEDRLDRTESRANFERRMRSASTTPHRSSPSPTKTLPSDGILPVFDAAMIAALQEPAVSLDRERQMLELTKQEATKYQDESRRIEREIATALGHAPDWFENRDEDDVMRALQDTSELTDTLRRQVSIQRELADVQDDLEEIEDRRANALTSQLLPWSLVKALGALFTVGSGLIFCGMFGSSFGWNESQRGALLIMGLIAASVAALLKFSLDNPARDGLRETDRRHEQLSDALSRLESEQQSLQEKLTAFKIGTNDLRETETRLVQLEALLPLEKQRRGTLELADQAGQRAIEIAKTMKHTRARWEQSLKALGLSIRITPEQMRALSGQSGSLAQLHRIREQRITELEEARREQQRIGERVRDLLADALVRPVGDSPSDHLNQLATALQQQNEIEKEHETMKQEDQRLRRDHQNVTSRLSQLQRNRRSQITSTGALDEDDLERMRMERRRYDELNTKRDEVRTLIQQTLGEGKQGEAIRRELERGDATELPQRLARAQADLDQSESRLKELQYRCGEITERLKQLTADQSLAATQLQLGTLQHHIEEGIKKWKVVSSIGGLLKGVYSKYEKDRQPDTLKDASRHLSKMTKGRYKRIWTPLAEDALLVEDSDGKSMPVEVLSRGTREQLFLSLRLALISCYARRGVKMPIVLDDVLVNFDADRTEAAAIVLADFARSGHQVLVFTCHKHIRELFENLQVDVRELPSNGARSIAIPSAEKPTQKTAAPEPALPAEPPTVAPAVPIMAFSGTPVLGFADEQAPVLSALRRQDADTFASEFPPEYAAEWHDAPATPLAAPPAFSASLASSQSGSLLGAIQPAIRNPNFAAATVGPSDEIALPNDWEFDDIYTTPPSNDAFLSAAADDYSSQSPFDEFGSLYDTPPLRQVEKIDAGPTYEASQTLRAANDPLKDSNVLPKTRNTDSKINAHRPTIAATQTTNNGGKTAQKTVVPAAKPLQPRTELPLTAKDTADRMGDEKSNLGASDSRSKTASKLHVEHDTADIRKRNEENTLSQPIKKPTPPTLDRRPSFQSDNEFEVNVTAPQDDLAEPGLLKPGFATRATSKQPNIRSDIRAKQHDAQSLTPTDVTTEFNMHDSISPKHDRSTDEIEAREDVLATAIDSDELEEDEYEYVEVDVDEDGNEIAAEDDEDEYEYVEVDDKAVEADGEEDEYEYVEVDVDEDGNEIEAADEEEYEFIDEDGNEVIAEDGEEDDEYEYVEVDVDDDGNEIEASDDEEDEYEYVDVDVDEDGNEIQASDDDEDEYEYVEVDEDDVELADEADSGMPSFGDMANAIKRKVTDVVEDLLDDQTDAA